MNNNSNLRIKINGQEDPQGDHGLRAAREDPADAGPLAATATPGRAEKDATEDGGDFPRAAEPRGGRSSSYAGGTRQGLQDGVGRPLHEEALREGKSPSAHLICVEAEEGAGREEGEETEARNERGHGRSRGPRLERND
jgi:hypothetical protein